MVNNHLPNYLVSRILKVLFCNIYTIFSSWKKNTKNYLKLLVGKYLISLNLSPFGSQDMPPRCPFTELQIETIYVVVQRLQRQHLPPYLRCVATTGKINIWAKSKCPSRVTVFYLCLVYIVLEPLEVDYSFVLCLCKKLSNIWRKKENVIYSGKRRIQKIMTCKKYRDK